MTRARSPFALPGAAAASLIAVCAGCQSYSPEPLDLSSHAFRVGSRAAEVETVARFAERLVASGSGAPERFDFADGLTPAEGEVLALFYNADLRLARLEAASALASLETAGLWQDPVFGFNAAEILSPEGPFEFGLMLEATIPVSGRLEAERDREAARYEAELVRLVEAEWAVRIAVRRAWAEWSDALMRERLLGEFVSDAQRVVELTDRLENAGELTRVESRLMQSQLVSARLEKVAAAVSASELRSELLGLMGLAADAPVELIEDPPAVSGQLPDDPIARLIESNPTLDALRASYHVAERTLRTEIRKQYPDLTIGAGYGNEDDDRLLLGFSVPIPVLNANRAGIAGARSDRDIARAEAETTFERLARRLDVAVNKARSAQAQRDAFERELIPLLDEQLEEVQSLINLGEVDTLLLLDSLSRQLAAKSRLLDLRLEGSLAWIEIDRLLGPEEKLDPAPVESAPEPEAHPKSQNTASAGSRAEENDQ